MSAFRAWLSIWTLLLGARIGGLRHFRAVEIDGGGFAIVVANGPILNVTGSTVTEDIRQEA